MDWLKEFWNKRKVKRKFYKDMIQHYQFGIKEELLFLLGLFLGISMGLIGNLFVSILMRWKDGLESTGMLIASFMGFFIILLIFVIWAWSIRRRMTKEYFELLENKGIKDENG